MDKYGFVVWWPGMENAECVSTLLEDSKTLSQSRFEKNYAKIEGVFAECNEWSDKIKDEGLIYVSYEAEGVYNRNVIERFASKLHDAVKKPIIIFALFRMYDGIRISVSQYIDKDCTVIRDSDYRIDTRRLSSPSDYSQYVYKMNSTTVTDKIENKRYLIIYDRSIQIQYGRHDIYTGFKYKNK